jgi:hypothetical protein
MIYWGVRAGGSVRRAFDAEAAFQEESRLRAWGWHEAQVVVSRDGREWRLVPWESVLRADPRPPQRLSEPRWVGGGAKGLIKALVAKWRGLDQVVWVRRGPRMWRERR